MNNREYISYKLTELNDWTNKLNFQHTLVNAAISEYSNTLIEKIVENNKSELECLEKSHQKELSTLSQLKKACIENNLELMESLIKTRQ
jgi:hypothetical protein